VLTGAGGARSAGYTVQTVRIATSALRGVESPAAARELGVALEGLALRHGVPFLSLGASSDAAFLAAGAVPQLAAALHNTSFSIAWEREWGLREARLLADAIFDTAQRSPSANFRFGVAFNCQPGTPFFPVARAGGARGFSIGTENSAMLHRAFCRAAAAGAGAGAGGDPLHNAHDALKHDMEAALRPVEEIASSLYLEADDTCAPRDRWAYLGTDSSIAPALEPPTIVESFARLGVAPRFGGAGTLAIAERVTAALKSLAMIKLCGYCGIMMPVCEDVGLAAAAASGALTVQHLLQFSAVCGVGLDTVPVPGPGAATPAAEREEMVQACAAVLLDTAAMAFRLNKPLSVRLLPVPGGAVGDATAFGNPYLVESALMKL
jgi:hypothetical protein